MTDEKLQKANDMQKQINELEYFLRIFDSDFNVFSLIKKRKITLMVKYDDIPIKLEYSKRLFKRIRKAIEDEFKELKKEYEEL